MFDLKSLQTDIAPVKRVNSSTVTTRAEINRYFKELELKKKEAIALKKKKISKKRNSIVTKEELKNEAKRKRLDYRARKLMNDDSEAPNGNPRIVSWNNNKKEDKAERIMPLEVEFRVVKMLNPYNNGAAIKVGDLKGQSWAFIPYHYIADIEAAMDEYTNVFIKCTGNSITSTTRTGKRGKTIGEIIIRGE